MKFHGDQFFSIVLLLMGIHLYIISFAFEVQSTYLKDKVNHDLFSEL